MKKRYLIFSVLLIAVLAVMLSGCGRQSQSLDGKNIVTFELGGGILNYGTASTDDKTKISYAYEPGSYILDPAELPNYKISKTDYVFTGWYTDEECTQKWDFATPFETETLTLYAGWKLAITYSYTVYYVDGDKTSSLGVYEVEAGEKFEDWRNYASKREGYTPIAYYSDPELTVPWDFTTAHPGGDEDLDIPVYADYIEGVWKLVDNYATLSSALKSDLNVYLTADVDCGGAELASGITYSGVFNGNGYTVSNLKVSRFGTTRKPSCAIFKALEGAEIKDVTFKDVIYDFELTTSGSNVSECQVAALALKAGDKTVDGSTVQTKISNVSISGKIVTNADETLITRLGELFYDEDSEAVTDGNTVNITFESKS